MADLTVNALIDTFMQATTKAEMKSAMNLETQGADIASASTINLETATGDLVDVTGTTTITAVTLSQGHRQIVRFTGILTLTHGASLVLPTGANIVTAAGDFAIFLGYASNVVRALYFRASGAALAGGVTSITGTANEITVTGTTTPTLSLPSALTFTGKTITGGTFASPTLTTLAFGTSEIVNLNREANYTLGIKNGTNPMAVRIFETDSGANDEYLEISAASGTNTIKPVATGSGTASAVRYYVTTTVWLGSRSGTPEAAETAGIGSICTDTATGAVYKKTSGTGNTGWVEMTSGGGAAPQPLQAAKQDATFSTTSATFADITGLTQAFTASSTTQKVLLRCVVYVGFSSAATIPVARLARDGTALGIAAASSSRIRAGGAAYDQAPNAWLQPIVLEWLDVPGTTSAVTYSVQLASTDGTNTVYVNRTHLDTDSTVYPNTTSTLTVIPFAE